MSLPSRLTNGGGVGPQWLKGPVDPAGVLIDLSDRPIVCSASQPGSSSQAGLVVLGCTDHASYVVDGQSGSLAATLYGKKAGHSEWLTGACFIGDGSGRIATCAMDGKAVLWGAVASTTSGSSSRRSAASSRLLSRQTAAPPASAKEWRGQATELLGHFGSVSLVTSPQPAISFDHDGAHRDSVRMHRYGHLLISAGYDKTIRIWDASTGGSSSSSVSSSTSARSSASSGYARTSPAVQAGTAPSSEPVAVLRGHDAPILCLSVLPAHVDSRTADTGGLEDVDCVPPGTSRPLVIASGDRDGVIKVWRLVPPHRGGIRSSSSAAASSEVAVTTLRGHAGHITALTWARIPTALATNGIGSAVGSEAAGDDDVRRGEWHLLSGAQDGHLRVWHVPRSLPSAADCDGDVTTSESACLHNLALHTSDKGAGAVTEIAVTSASALSRPLILTAGADKTLCVIDPAVGYRQLHRITTHIDFIYCMTLHGHLSLSGSGDGTLICHDIFSGRPLWGLGANTAAVRTINVLAGSGGGGERLVVSGDDGKAIVYDFSSDA